MTNLVIPMLIIVACLFGIALAISKLYDKINELLEAGISASMSMTISDDDIQKIVELVLDEIDKRHE